MDPTPFQIWAAQPDNAAIDEACQWVASGGHLNGFIKEKGFSYVTMLRWINASTERAEMYARAREDRADVLADEIVAIADEVSTVIKTSGHGEDAREELVLDATAVARNRLRVDARKWAASKLKPKAYGDKVQQELTGADGGPINHSLTVEFVNPPQ